MPLRVWEIGEVANYDEPVVVLVGSHADVKEAAKLFGRLVELAPVTSDEAQK